MAPDPNLTELDRIGSVFCRLGHQRLTLAWARDPITGASYYYVDGHDCEDRFFSGMGDTPSEALAIAQRDLKFRFAPGFANA